jgi:Subtilase family
MRVSKMAASACAAMAMIAAATATATGPAAAASAWPASQTSVIGRPGMPVAGRPGMPVAGRPGMPVAGRPGMPVVGRPGMPVVGRPDVPAATASGSGARVRAACGAVRAGYARCLVLYAPQTRVNAAIAARAAGHRVPPAAVSPKGWGATDIESAYKLPVSADPHATVAVVDAFSTPHLAADLGVYRKQYGLPSCTASSGCLRIVNQQGKASPLPKPDPQGWGVEETLDVDMVSAACPLCKILVVEAKTASFANLGSAENTAARLGAVAVSNSYGARENGFTQGYAKDYRHPGHTIVASSGDFGFTAAAFPANLASVTSVGGTELARSTNARGWTEKVWNNIFGASGSGCSAYVAKPAWQHDPDCPGRTAADVAAVAWNIPIYDSSLPKQAGGPWLTVGGTSASSPLIAGVYALAGKATTVKPGSVYAHPGGLFDVAKGNNDWFNNTGGAACGHDYLCVAKKRYDAPPALAAPTASRTSNRLGT